MSVTRPLLPRGRRLLLNAAADGIHYRALAQFAHLRMLLVIRTDDGGQSRSQCERVMQRVRNVILKSDDDLQEGGAF